MIEEYDDHLALMQILSKKLSPINFAIPEEAKKSYQYLIEEYLFTSYDMAKLKDKVIDVYCERVRDCQYDSQSDYIPDIYEISDLIDYENMEILREFYTRCDFSENDIEDIILGYYIQNVSYALSDWVEQILFEQGFPVGKSTSCFTESTNRMVFDKKYAPQNIMFYEFLY